MIRRRPSRVSGRRGVRPYHPVPPTFVTAMWQKMTIYGEIHNMTRPSERRDMSDRGSGSSPRASRRAMDEILDRCRASGAVDALVIDPHDVETADWVRLKCQYGCSHHGTSHCCPPYTPTPEATRRVLDAYGCAVLLRFGDQAGAHRVSAALEKEAFAQGFYKALALAAGPCRLCKVCDLDGCRHPASARPSMEACGIDVFATVRAQGLAIKVVAVRTCDAQYFALLLVE